MKLLKILFFIGLTTALKAQVVSSELPFGASLLFKNSANQSLEFLSDQGHFQFVYKTGLFRKLPSKGLETICSNPLSNTTYFYVNTFNKTYFLLNGGGELYSLSKDQFLREDQSFAHKNQFGGHFFSDFDKLYYYGGYGLFRSKDFFIYYNWPTSDWQIVLNDSKEIPKGRMNALYEARDSKIYIAGGIHASGTDQVTYLKDVFAFDLKEKRYLNMGVLNPALQSIDFNWFTPSSLDFGFFINKDSELVRVSIANNKYVTYQKFDTFLSKTISPLEILKDSLYYIVKIDSSHYLNRISLKDLGALKKQEALLFTKAEKNTPLIYQILFGIAIVIIVYFLFRVFAFVDLVKKKKER